MNRPYVWQELQGNEAPELGVLGLIHDAHPAAAKLLENAIVRNDLSGHRWVWVPRMLGLCSTRILGRERHGVNSVHERAQNDGAGKRGPACPPPAGRTPGGTPMGAHAGTGFKPAPTPGAGPNRRL